MVVWCFLRPFPLFFSGSEAWAEITGSHSEAMNECFFRKVVSTQLSKITEAVSIRLGATTLDRYPMHGTPQVLRMWSAMTEGIPSCKSLSNMIAYFCISLTVIFSTARASIPMGAPRILATVLTCFRPRSLIAFAVGRSSSFLWK